MEKITQDENLSLLTEGQTVLRQFIINENINGETFSLLKKEFIFELFPDFKQRLEWLDLKSQLDALVASKSLVQVKKWISPFKFPTSLLSSELLTKISNQEVLNQDDTLEIAKCISNRIQHMGLTYPDRDHYREAAMSIYQRIHMFMITSLKYISQLKLKHELVSANIEERSHRQIQR